MTVVAFVTVVTVVTVVTKKLISPENFSQKTQDVTKHKTSKWDKTQLRDTGKKTVSGEVVFILSDKVDKKCPITLILSSCQG